MEEDQSLVRKRRWAKARPSDLYLIFLASVILVVFSAEGFVREAGSACGSSEVGLESASLSYYYK